MAPALDPAKVKVILEITATIPAATIHAGMQPTQEVLDALAKHMKCDLVAALVAATFRPALTTGSDQVPASPQVPATGGARIRDDVASAPASAPASVRAPAGPLDVADDDDGFTTPARRRVTARPQVAARPPVAANTPLETVGDALDRAKTTNAIHLERLRAPEGDDLERTKRRICPSLWPARPGQLATPCLGTAAERCRYQHPDPCQDTACLAARLPGCTLFHVPVRRRAAGNAVGQGGAAPLSPQQKWQKKRREYFKRSMQLGNAVQTQERLAKETASNTRLMTRLQPGQSRSYAAAAAPPTPTTASTAAPARRPPPPPAASALPPMGPGPAPGTREDLREELDAFCQSFMHYWATRATQ